MVRRQAWSKLIIGVTGGTGAGKTTVLRVIKGIGGGVVDCDEVYHDLLRSNQTMLNELRVEFKQAFDENGKLNRKKLGIEVFQDTMRMAKLHEIVDKYLLVAIKAKINLVLGENDICVVDGISLIESGLSGMCDVTIAVTAPIETRAQRIMERDGISEQYARSRIASQQPDSFYQDHCDYVLHNEYGSLEEFSNKVLTFLTNRVIGSIGQLKSDE